MSKLKNDGYTLLEMLMVMFVLGVMIYIISFNFNVLIRNEKLSNEVSLFCNAYEILRNISIKNNKDSAIVIEDNKLKCYIKEELMYEHKVEKGVEISSNFANNKININDDGVVKTGGTINYKYNNKAKSIVIHLGSGSYEVR